VALRNPKDLSVEARAAEGEVSFPAMAMLLPFADQVGAAKSSTSYLDLNNVLMYTSRVGQPYLPAPVRALEGGKARWSEMVAVTRPSVPKGT
jgi:hypothetical protein